MKRFKSKLDRRQAHTQGSIQSDSFKTEVLVIHNDQSQNCKDHSLCDRTLTVNTT